LTSTPRILALVSSRVLYGQERANLLVLETLMAQGCEILAVVEDHPAFRTMPQELSKRGITFVEAPGIGRRVDGYLLDFIFGNPTRYWRARHQLKALISDFRPTHIHVSNPFGFLMADAIAPRDLPIVYLSADLPILHNALSRFIWHRITHRVTLFVAMSKFIAANLETHAVPNGKIEVIFWPPALRQRPAQPKIAPKSDRHFLFIGQIRENKGVDRLVEAFRRVVVHYPDASLTILGRISDWKEDGWQRALRETVLNDPSISGRVFFAGESDDVYGYLASAAFLVVPSVWEEPFGLVVGEAKAAARPSVVFPQGGLPEQIVHCEDGFICKDTSIEALADAITYYLSDPPRARMHGKAALSSLQRLGADQFAERWLAVYQNTALAP
jgi:glycosyltransferase involved in cell wall biosynthesis